MNERPTESEEPTSPLEVGEILVWVTNELPLTTTDYTWDCNPTGVKYRFDGLDGNDVLLTPHGCSTQMRFPKTVLNNLIRDRRHGEELTPKRAEEALKAAAPIRRGTEETVDSVVDFLRNCHVLDMDSHYRP